ncbi:nucleoside hydrolase-like domain-containing protein [Croceivirga radicis]|uniref:nucleoside hydrolase-like domain-containing protein n=1 Tax=Croceivirga radicis TaxID=1929488 RepID=UPI000255B279|nr:nucleoside hydrolase-like domain-containing protein [Croceivirga radicis]
MKSTPKPIFNLIVLFVLLLASTAGFAQQEVKPRLFVLTDIEADPDDTQSLVRLLLYSNKLEIRGLVATTSCWHKNEVNPESILQVLDAYGKVRDNLLKHEGGYPTKIELVAKVKTGPPKYGLLGVGKNQTSSGSQLLVEELKKKDERPLWVSVWGGANVLAQALYDLKATTSQNQLDEIVSKIRVYTISDQDDSGIWIRKNFPKLFYVVSPGDDYGTATWTGINTVVKNWDNTTISNTWLAKNIQQDHGPLGAVYPDVSWGVEGDTPAFLGVIPNGLNHPERPDYGGWGGRYTYYLPKFEGRKRGSSGVPFEPETRKIWTDTIDTYEPYVFSNYGRNVKLDSTKYTGGKVSIWRWRDEIQNDFAARMDWTINTFTEANHPPVPVLSHATALTVKSGQGFALDASKSYDPDGDSLSYLWFVYKEAGSFKGEFNIGQPGNSHTAYVVAPKVAQKETIHIILKLTDKGTPALTRYKRIIVTVVP